MGVGGQRHAPATLPPGKTRYPLYRRLGGPQDGLDECENLAATGIRSPDSPSRNEPLEARRGFILVYYNQHLDHYQDRPETCGRLGQAVKLARLYTYVLQNFRA